MTTKLKFYLLTLLSIICLTTFTACEDDEDIGYGLSGPNGKTWYGDFGASDRHGYPLNSEITFITGSRDDHGIGRENLYYADNLEYYDTYNFDWEIRNGQLCIYYDSGTMYIHDYYIGHGTFSGYLENGFHFELYLDRRW